MAAFREWVACIVKKQVLRFVRLSAHPVQDDKKEKGLREVGPAEADPKNDRSRTPVAPF
jgi:hypothetical protein